MNESRDLPTILLTGFNAFGARSENPSELVVRAMATREVGEVEVVTEVLPTEFRAASRRLKALLRKHHPDAVVCLGLATGRRAIQLERVALNLDDCESPDNVAETRSGRRIIRDGPVAYWSTLPLEKMREVLVAAGFEAVISNHAGTFLCNHVFYLARHVTETTDRPIPCGFIHLPELGPNAGGATEPWTPERLADAVAECLRVLRLGFRVGGYDSGVGRGVRVRVRASRPRQRYLPANRSASAQDRKL